MFLLGGRAGGRGKRTPAILAASALDWAPEDRPKGYMTLSNSSFKAAGFAGGRGRSWNPFVAQAPNSHLSQFARVNLKNY